ncbi:MAG: recombinase, partial [Mucilaginibacter sp.]|nr:recombinase [Mucilaginibacter sp.]
FHLSRYLATTITLTNGVPIESVSKMLGHVNIKTTQHYAKVIDTKVSQDMKKLRRKLTTHIIAIILTTHTNTSVFENTVKTPVDCSVIIA